MAAASATDKSVQLKFLVDKERKKVVYAEAGKDFVDVLFSFITMPLGTIVRLLSKESNIKPLSIGSLSSMYQKVIDIDEQYLSTPACKEMLLNPRNSMEDYCLPMKLNIDDTEPVKYFRCEDWYCNRSDSGSPLSTFKNQKCSCGKVMAKSIFPKWLNRENGFVKENAPFIICDNLNVMPNVFETIVSLLQKIGIENSDTIQEQTVDITKKEVIDLLKLSLFSKTPLTDFIFNKKQLLSNSNTGDKSVFDIGKVVSSDEGKEMLIKVKLRKSDGEVVFTEVEEDFVDFLYSFLTFPLGGVLNMLQGFTLGCLSNLHESMKVLNLDRYLISQDLKDKLVKPKIASQFDLTNQILPIGTAASLPVYYCHTYYNDDFLFEGYNVGLRKDMVYLKNTYKISQEKFVRFSFVDPKPSSSRSSTSGGFVKGPSTYMVTKDLVVAPMSYAFAMSYLSRSKVSLFDLEEKAIKIGCKEALCILKAFLVTDNALTNCLNQFLGTVKDPVKIEVTIKEEN